LAGQIVPRTYWSKYSANGVRYLSIWRMWLGRAYDVMTVPLDEIVPGVDGGSG